MLSAKENFLETIKPDGKPDRLVKQYEGAVFYPPNPAASYIRGNRHPGMDPLIDRFGTEILWPANQVAAMPHVTDKNKVISDITEWKEQLVMPDLQANCSDPALWEPFIKKADEIRANGDLVMAFMPTGVFERLHFLMGFEDMLMNYLLEPEDMMDLCNAIGEYRFQYMKLIVDYIKPDVMLSHDDWGSKHSLFIRKKHPEYRVLVLTISGQTYCISSFVTSSPCFYSFCHKLSPIMLYCRRYI